MSSDVLLSVALKGSEVIVDVEGENHSFPSDNREENMSESFVAPGSGSAEVFGCKIGLLQEVLVFGVFLFEMIVYFIL